MVETDLPQSYFTSLGFQQFAGKIGDHGQVIQKYFQIFLLIEWIIESFPSLAFLRHFRIFFHVPMQNKPSPEVWRLTCGGFAVPVRKAPSTTFLPDKFPRSWSVQGIRGCPSALLLATLLSPRRICALHVTILRRTSNLYVPFRPHDRPNIYPLRISHWNPSVISWACVANRPTVSGNCTSFHVGNRRESQGNGLRTGPSSLSCSA